jgi:hypothetical protein
MIPGTTEYQRALGLYANEASSSSTEDRNTRISTIYNRIKLALENSDNYFETLNSFNSKDIYSQLSPDNQAKLYLFIRLNCQTSGYTEEEKTALLAHVAELEESAKKEEGPPPVMTFSGRVSPRSSKFVSYTKELSREGPENFREPSKRKKTTKKNIAVPAPLQAENLARAERSRSPTPPINAVSSLMPNSAIKESYEKNLSADERVRALSELNVATMFEDDEF